MRKQMAVPAATLSVALALFAAACGGSSSPSKQGSPAASPGSTTTSGSPAASGGTQPSAAAWCAIVIDINTRGGTMVNKNYIKSGLRDPVKAKAVAQEGVNRRSEILAITPPEIRDAMAHELDYYAAVLKSPSAGLGDFTAADLQALISFQKTKCGIGGI